MTKTTPEITGIGASRLIGLFTAAFLFFTNRDMGEVFCRQKPLGLRRKDGVPN
ncbi:MAG: hypothetical protein ACJ71W_10810 [Terriglobales bacterium]